MAIMGKLSDLLLFLLRFGFGPGEEMQLLGFWVNLDEITLI